MSKLRESLIGFGQRVKDVRDFLDISQKDFAEKPGAANSFISDIETEKTKPGYDILVKMAHTFNISPNFILPGKGKMFLDEQEDLPGDLDLGEDTQMVIDLLKYFKKSPLVKMAWALSTFGTIDSHWQGKKFPPVPLHYHDFQYNENGKNNAKKSNQAKRRKI
jgi:transcriptional regulator with XRE-family HTH domain